MKRFQTASEYFLETGPIVFHSFWSLVKISAVSFHSVLSFRDSAFSHNAFFFSRLAFIPSFSNLKNSPFFLKNSSQALRKRSKIFTFIFCGAKPIVFHLFCRAITSCVLVSHAANVFNWSNSIASTISQITVFWSKLCCSLSFRASKCCWWRRLTAVEAALKRFHISSRNSLATGPVSRNSWCSFCNWWKAETTSCSSANFSAASQRCVLISRFFLKSYSLNSLFSFNIS